MEDYVDIKNGVRFIIANDGDILIAYPFKYTHIDKLYDWICKAKEEYDKTKSED